MPVDRYYLADAGYGLTMNFLTPYRGVRYHLKEFSQGTQKPQNPKELFNLRHASLRNVIERVFGVLKKRFPILKSQSEYGFPTQVHLVKVLCILHNFIKRHGDTDNIVLSVTDEELLEAREFEDMVRNRTMDRHVIVPASREERAREKVMREKIDSSP
jgi:hypothetical protein